MFPHFFVLFLEFELANVIRLLCQGVLLLALSLWLYINS